MIRSCLWFGLILLTLTGSLWAADPLEEEKPPEPLANIVKLQEALGEEAQQLSLVFKGDYSQSISYLFDPGVFSAILPDSQFDPALANLRINNPFVQQVRLRREGRNSILEVRYADPAFSAAGKVTHEASFERLTFKLFKHQPEPKLISAPVTAAQEVAEASGDGATKDQLQNQKFEGMGMGTLIQTLAALAFILVLIYSGLWAYNRFVLRKMSFRRGKYKINLASSFFLSPKQRVVVLEVNDMAFACGVTPTQIGVIAQVDKQDFGQFMGRRGPAGQDSVDFAQLREEYRQSRAAALAPQAEVEAPGPSFAAEFLDKVRKLKPID